MFSLIASLVILIIPIMYIINVFNKEQRHIIQAMRRRQKRNYYLSFIGSLFLILIFIVLFIFALTLLLDTVMNDLGALGYLIMFAGLPIIFTYVVGVGVLAALYFTIRPSAYQSKQNNASLVFMFLGLSILVTIPIFLYFMEWGMIETLSILGTAPRFIYILDVNTFHLVNLIYSILFIGPVILLLGWNLCIIDYYKHQKVGTDDEKSEYSSLKEVE